MIGSCLRIPTQELPHRGWRRPIWRGQRPRVEGDVDVGIHLVLKMELWWQGGCEKIADEECVQYCEPCFNKFLAAQRIMDLANEVPSDVISMS